VEEFVQGRVVDIFAARVKFFPPLVVFVFTVAPEHLRILIVVQMKAVEAAVLARIFLDVEL